MATTAKLGFLLLTLLLIWIVVYYQLVAPAMQQPQPPSGLTLTSGDTIGTAPDETNRNSSITSPPQENHPAQINDIKKSINNNQTNPNPNANNELNEKQQQPEVKGKSPEANKPVTIPPPPPTTPYTVKRGDTMQTIAKDWFGSYDKWVLISQENPLVDPQKLKVGQLLRLPPKNTRLESIPADLYKELTKEILYTVSPGDTLSGIARQFYGKADLYPIILKANQDTIRDADSLAVGTKLRIPKYQQPAD